MQSLNPVTSAVLIMDYQNEIVANYGHDDPQLTKRAASLLHAARPQGIPIIHIVVKFRPNYPEVGSRGNFTKIKQAARLQEENRTSDIHPDVTPADDDVVVVKKRVGAFYGSDLEIILKALGVEHLILMGIATSGVVLTTVRWAADLDYLMTVVADCCADSDPEVHRVLTQKVFKRQCNVVSSEEFLEQLVKG